MEPSIKKLDYLFAPRSVAVIGASGSFGKWGFGIIHQVLKFKGDFSVYPINPKMKEVLGVKAYQNITRVPGDIDFAVIVIPPQNVPAAMADCASKGVKAVLVITAGFREIGEEGARLEAEMLQIARQAGIRVAGPNCNGHFNTAINLFTMGIRGIKPGPLSLISQSGNFGGFIVGQGIERGIGFSKYISSGNEADVTIEDYIEYLGDDPETKIICAYAEGLKDGRRFFNLARNITREKPIIMMKVGRTEEGANAARSHTGSLSGSTVIHDAALRQAGVIQVYKADEMLDVASALIRQPLPRGRRVGIVTGGGGFGVVAADACRSLGLEIPELSEETITSLNRWMPSRWSHANPVDMAGDSYGSIPTLGTMLKSENVDAVLAVSCLGFPAQPPEEFPLEIREEFKKYQKQMVEGEVSLMDGLIERMERYNKPLIIAAVSGRDRSKAIAKLEENDIYTYRSPEDAASVMAYLANYADYLSRS
ncbi:MAG: CoA-binding protein [Deltaproteobacteria bacterium]|nr:CoA-binding protein [Deltaproteobacteria bacterium]